MTRVYVRPAVAGNPVPRGTQTRDVIAAEGEWIENSQYIARRLLDRSLVEAEPPIEAAAETKPTPAKK